MVSSSRRFESRTSATTSASSNQGTSNRGTVRTSAREQCLIEADKAKSQAKTNAAKTEETRRTEPITGTVVGYDSETGSYLIETPDGGIIRAQNMGNGAPVGLRQPIQRFAGSQSTRFTTPTTTTGGSSVSQVEAVQRDTINLLAVETIDIRIEAPENTEYTIAPYQHYAVRIETVIVDGAPTVTTTPAVGEVAAVGDPISITVADSDPDTPLLASILLRRV